MRPYQGSKLSFFSEGETFSRLSTVFFLRWYLSRALNCFFWENVKPSQRPELFFLRKWNLLGGSKCDFLRRWNLLGGPNCFFCYNVKPAQGSKLSFFLKGKRSQGSQLSFSRECETFWKARTVFFLRKWNLLGSPKWVFFKNVESSPGPQLFLCK